MKTCRQLLCMLLTLLMLVSLLPASALADEPAVQWAGAMNYNDANNCVTAQASVTAPENTELRWQYQLGTVANFGAYYAGQSVIAGDYLYATGGGKLHKIALADGVGTVINESAGSTGNYYDYLCYADGKLLVATQTKISAYGLDGSLLGSVEGSFGFYHPVQYHDGYVFCNGNIFSLSNDGTTFTRVGEGTIGGDAFNWSSGAFANGLFYVAAKTTIYAVDYTTNTVTDSFEFDASRTATSSTQGGVAYDSGTKRLYWGTYTCNTDIHSVALNDQGKFDTESYIHADAGQKSVCTPVVSGGRVYLAGQSGNISVLNADDLSLIYSVSTGAGKIQSNPILSTAGEAVSVYVQGYDGNLYVMQDNGTSGTITKLAAALNPNQVQYPNAYEQIAMDTQGRIYCYNESGFLFCYGPSACEVPQITADLSTEEVKYALDAEADALVVTASVSDGGTLSYQWQSGTDGMAWENIPDATAASYTPQTETAAETYYRCIVTNTKDAKTASAASNAAFVITKILSTNTGLSVITTTSNSITAGTAAVSPENDHFDVLSIGGKRVWLGAVDPFASISVSLVGGNAGTAFSDVRNAREGITYTKRFYKNNFDGTELFKITVTAEDGVTTKDYTLTISSEATADTAFTAFVTLADSGALVADKNGKTVAQAEIAVTDHDADGAITVDDALYAAHEALYPGGAAAGYASADTAYGLAITKLWGDESGCFGYCVNDVSCWSLSDTVMDGGYVTAFVYSDKDYWCDAYSYFMQPTAEATAGTAITLALKSSGYDAEWNPVSVPCQGAKIRVIGSNNSVRQPLTTDENGCVSLTFTANGSYCVEAYKDDGSIVPSVCKVTVTGAAQPAAPVQDAKVYFTLKGDTVHSGSLHVGTSYPTWIGKTAVDYTEGMTVGDVFKTVLDAAADCSYNASELTAGYIRTITYRGTELSEFTNGANSGWMYTVNGEYPEIGLNDCPVFAGDEIVWKYVDDYTQESTGYIREQKKEEEKQPENTASSFVDVPENTYYSAAVGWAVENGITSGTDKTHFSPDAICTRGQMVTFLWRAAGCPEPTLTGSDFIDIQESSYAYKAILWAVENKIALGVSNTEFAPDMTLDRAQAVTFLYRFEKPAVGGKINPFRDVSETAYYYDAVLWAYASGVTGGTSVAVFSPGNACSRGQIVTFLYRAFMEEPPERSGWEKELGEAAAYVLKTTPAPRFGSVGGEWAVLGLARGGYTVPADYYSEYYAALEKTVAEAKGVLSTRKYTEYSRVIVALAAIGRDARNVAGYDLTMPLGDYEKTIYQGTSGPVWALIALDSRNYPMPVCPDAAVPATRQMYIDRLLETQNTDGGWGIGAAGASDIDMTAMALQALAGYREQKPVAVAVEKALAFLSGKQGADGAAGESTAQILVALCTLGIEPDDSRFIKNGKPLLDDLDSYRVSGGGYAHIRGGEVDPMASEQALYALAAVWRAQSGMPELYNMV